MKAMLAYLEAARYKVQCSLDELNNRPRMTHPLAKHIEVHRDKQGLNFSVLKVSLVEEEEVWRSLDYLSFIMEVCLCFLMNSVSSKNTRKE